MDILAEDGKPVSMETVSPETISFKLVYTQKLLPCLRAYMLAKANTGPFYL